MDALLLTHCGLAETCVPGDALLEGASAGTSLSLQYCKYLVSALSSAVANATDPSLEQPQQCMQSVFVDTWHVASLACLSDADIAHLWRLGDFLLLDAVAFECLEDVIVQRRLRSEVANRLVEHLMLPPARNSLLKRLAVIKWTMRECADLTGYRLSDDVAHLIRGLTIPSSSKGLEVASMWHHSELVQRAVGAGVEWDDRVTAVALLEDGDLHRVQRLRLDGAPWAPEIVNDALVSHAFDKAMWALERGAPFDGRTWLFAASYSCLPVLKWAYEHGRLTRKAIPAYISLLQSRTHSAEMAAAAAAWLAEVLAPRAAAGAANEGASETAAGEAGAR